MENWIESDESKQLAAQLQLSVGALVIFFSFFCIFLTGSLLTPDCILIFPGICFLIASGFIGYQIHNQFMDLSGKHYYRIGQLDRLIIMHEKKLKNGWKQFKDEEPKNGQHVWLHTNTIFAPDVDYSTYLGKNWRYSEGKDQVSPEDYWMPFSYPEPPKVP